MQGGSGGTDDDEGPDSPICGWCNSECDFDDEYDCQDIEEDFCDNVEVVLEEDPPFSCDDNWSDNCDDECLP